ncbi:MAG: hypothetical protein NTX63_01020 [Candidatus Peregrinibacteria bacterium]|nr:hypothetical protein [Candidatus Peregrinibacteria bacterium]
MERKEVERETRSAEITKPDSAIDGIAGGVRNRVNKIVDFIRTAPVGYGLFLYGVYLGAEYIQDSQIRDNIVSQAFTVGAAVFNVLGGYLIASKQFAVKRKLEKKCAANGYSDKIFQKTTPTWCDRQTARVVTRRLGKLDKYTELCDKNKKEQQFSWLGHF